MAPMPRDLNSHDSLKVWRAGRLPPPKVATRDLGVDTQWVAWRCPVQCKRVITFRQSMNRVRWLGLPATSKARIVKSLFSVGLYVAEVGGTSASHMNDVRISARKALGKGTNLRRSSPLELMASGGPAGDPQVFAADLSTVRAWQRKLAAGTLDWPLEPSVWEHALGKGWGLANRLGWMPQPGGWISDGQYFSWCEADYKVKWDSARVLLADVAAKRPDFR
eukprot:1477334-Amphidinium_carterae.1